MSVIGHVAVDPSLVLPECYHPVEARLRAFDLELRLRRSADYPGFYVLERRVKRGKPVHTKYRDMRDIDVQERDGYIHVTTVHPSFMETPDRMIEKLREAGGDLHAPGNNADTFWWNLVCADRRAREERKAKRFQMFREYYRDMYDVVVNRMGNDVGAERYRINAAGPEQKLNIRKESSAREILATERSDDVHPFGTQGHQQDGQLHDQSPDGSAGDNLHERRS